MSVPLVKIHNTETGEIIEREMNAEELAQYEADALAVEQRVAEIAAQAQQKAAILERLGLTEEEAKVLLG